jgi:hypothetical protein
LTTSVAGRHSTTKRPDGCPTASCDDSARGTRRFSAARQDGERLAIGPVEQHALEEIQIGTSRQWVEEALADGRDTIGHARGLKDLRRSSHCWREIDQGALHHRMSAKDSRQERSRTAADVNHGAHRFPAAGDLQV